MTFNIQYNSGIEMNLGKHEDEGLKTLIEEVIVVGLNENCRSI